MRKANIRLIFTVAFLLLTLFSQSAFTEVCKCEAEISGQIPTFDAAVYLSVNERYKALERHLHWGIPVNPDNATNETLIILRHYIVNYDSDLNTPTWVAHRLTEQNVDKTQPGYVVRKDCFRNYPQDLHPDLSPPLCSDYDRDSYDRGRLVNSNDMRRSRTANANSFFLINMAPQYPDFNQNIWWTLENRVHSLAKSKKIIYVITGAVFDDDGDGSRDNDNLTNFNDGDEKIAVATHFYKIIFHERPNGFIDALTIMLPPQQ